MRNSKGENIEYWDRFSNKYDNFVDKRIRNYSELIGLIAKDVDGSANILEIGTGTGLIALELVSDSQHVDATDVSQGMIDAARNKAKEAEIDNIDFHVCSGYELPFPNNCYDTVVISNVLHIMKHPENALSEAGRVLKDNGRLIAPTLMHNETLKAAIISRIMTTFSGFKVYHRWKSDSFRLFLEENRFEILTFCIYDELIPKVYTIVTPTKPKV